jgi:cytochrome P450
MHRGHDLILTKIWCRLAGSDTTAVALRAIFYFVVKNPLVYKKLMAEIDEHDKAGKLSSLITYEQASAMPYL